MASETGSNRIKGTVLITRLKMLRRQGGPSLVDKAIDLLPPSDRNSLRGLLLPVAWYPLNLGVRLDAVIAGLLSPDDRARAYMDMGRASADDNLNGAHREFLQAGDPHYLLSKAPQIYRFYYGAGHRTYEKTGPSAAVVRTFDADCVTEADCLTVIGWHQRAVEMSGGKNVKIGHPLCRAKGAAHCEYRISWN